MNRIDRLVAIILLLQSKKVTRAKDIARHFHISIRTVYRDMNALCEAGVPVAAEAGEGYSLVEGYHLPPVMFTPEEATTLFLGGKFVTKLTDDSLTEHAESALLKIQSVLAPETQAYLEQLRQSTALFIRECQPNRGFSTDTLWTLQKAVVHRTCVSLEYYSKYRDSFSQRTVEPLGLVYYADHWHLIAFCRLREDYRDFRTDRIKSMRLTDWSFPPRQGFTLKEYLKDFFEIESPNEIQIKFDNRVVESVRERYAFGLVDEEPDADGIIMTFMVPDTRWIARWLLSYGTFATVISPDSLRQQLLEEAKNVLRHYQK